MPKPLDPIIQQNKQNLAICPDCDVILLAPKLKTSERANCPRCDAVLDEGGCRNINQLLPLTITGIVLIILANSFPLLTMNANGQLVDSSLFSASVSLWTGDQKFLSILVFLTTILTPLIQLLAYAWLLIPMSFGKIWPFSDPILRLSHHSAPWNMMEIFLLGFIIAVVKLGEDALIIPGPSLYAFVGLIIVMTVLNIMFVPSHVREEIHERKQSWLT